MIRRLFDHIRKPALSILVILFAAANFILWGTRNSVHRGHEIELGDYTANAIDPEIELDTPMTYKQLKAAEEKFDRAERLQKKINEGQSGDATIILPFGFAELQECRSCTSIDDFDKRRKTGLDTSYYLLLPGFGFKEEETNYLVSRNTPWIAFSKYNPTGPVDSVSHWGHHAFRKLPARFYIETEKEENQRRKLSIMISVSRGVYKYVGSTMNILFALGAFILFYFGVVVPANILISISKGEIFTPYNESRLFIAARCWLLPPLIIFVVRYINRWIFYKYITDDVELIVFETLKQYQPFLIGGLTFWCVATAFKRGRLLQEEQSLTI